MYKEAWYDQWNQEVSSTKRNFLLSSFFLHVLILLQYFSIFYLNIVRRFLWYCTQIEGNNAKNGFPIFFLWYTSQLFQKSLKL